MPITDDMHSTELEDAVYFSTVLRLHTGDTESEVDRRHQREAQKLGLDLAKGDGSLPGGQYSLSQSAVTVDTHHRRSGSTSELSQSTGYTSHSENLTPDSLSVSLLAPPPLFGHKLETSRSIGEFDRFLMQSQSPPSFLQVAPISPPRTVVSSTGRGAPSLFSVSTRKSLVRLRKSLGRFTKFGRKNRDTDYQ
jgi:hypothetical protein